jgi:hypothetical protein
MRSLLIFIGLVCVGVGVSAGATVSDRWAELIQHADRLSAAGRLREVEECLAQALHEAESFAPNDTRMAVTLGRLGTAVWNLGKRAEAEPLYLRALKLWERNGMSDNPDAAATLSCLGTIRRLSGRFREAEALHQRSLTITEVVFGPASPSPPSPARISRLTIMLGANIRKPYCSSTRMRMFGAGCAHYPERTC